MEWNDKRAENFDKLEWANDFNQLAAIINAVCYSGVPDNLLEVGCGTGKLTECLADKRGYSCFDAVDPSEEMLLHAKSKCSGVVVSFFNCKIEDFVPFCKYDVIVMRNVLHHVDDINLVLAKCYDMLKDQGSVVVAEGVPSADGWHIFHDALLLKEDRHILTMGEWSAILERAGFRQQVILRGLFKDTSLNSLLDNDGTLSENRKEAIKDLYRDASDLVKESYNVRFIDDDILCDFIYVVIQGERK